LNHRDTETRRKTKVESLFFLCGELAFVFSASLCLCGSIGFYFVPRSQI
jgi:hypothetical protein